RTGVGKATSEAISSGGTSASRTNTAARPIASSYSQHHKHIGEPYQGALAVTLQAESAPLPDEQRKPKSKRKRKANSRAAARRRGRKAGSAARRRFFLKLKKLPDDACLTFAEWVALNALSERQGRRILGSGQGPAVTRLSEHRIGIRVGDNRAWQKSRTRGSE